MGILGSRFQGGKIIVVGGVVRFPRVMSSEGGDGVHIAPYLRGEFRFSAGIRFRGKRFASSFLEDSASSKSVSTVGHDVYVSSFEDVSFLRVFKWLYWIRLQEGVFYVSRKFVQGFG
eukprot:snap_masked-scaffold_3-processed-gene-17.24-mRNA-1 protein AED:1.00 eAED:1.00 QI:0/0/0/0/1/1/3/0/116